LSKPKVVIFGAAGFVGRNLSEHLSRTYQVVETDAMESSSPFGNEYIKLDIMDQEGVLRVVSGSDYVVHLAAHALGPSMKDPVMNAKVNIVGTLNILEAARKQGVKKVIFTSASSVVGEAAASPVLEDAPVSPKTPYGVAKLACEHYLRIYGELWNLDYVVFRFFNVYGPHQRSGLIPSLYAKISQGKPVEITGDGKQIRDFIYVKDSLKFFEKAMADDSISKTLLNMGTGKGTAIIDIADTAFKALGKPRSIQYLPARKGEISNFVADTEKLRGTFGFVPETPVEVGVAESIAWLSKNS